MTPPQVDEVDERAWLAWRRDGVTATDVADAATGDDNAIDAVVDRKLGSPPPPTPAMERGRRWQTRITAAAAVLTGLSVVGEEILVEHPVHRWRRATLDALLATTPDATLDDGVVAVLEVKTSASGVNVGQQHQSRSRWMAQVQWQLHVTGLTRAVLAVAEIDNTRDACVAVNLIDVDADPVAQARLVEIADMIRDRVARRRRMEDV